jgi:transglutaminase-like putative cysteine protease
MRRFAWCLLLVLFVRPAAAAEPQGKLVEDLWDVAYLDGQKAGYFHTTVREIERDGQKLLRGNVVLDLNIQRYKALANLHMESGTEETPSGEVTRVSMRQVLDKNHEIVLTGTVEDGQLHIVVPGQMDKRVPWNKDVIGLDRQERIFHDRKVKPGDRFSYLSYEPIISCVVTVRAIVKDPEEVEVLGVKKRLLRVETAPDKVEVSGNSVQLPGMVLWLDKDLYPARSQVEMPGIGKTILYRTTRAVATAPGAAAFRLPDLGLNALIPLARTVPNPYLTRSAVYRITLKDDDDPKTALADDDQQRIAKVDGNTLEIHVRPRRLPRALAESKSPGAEYLQSSYFLNSDDARVRELARRAVGREKDPWKQALAIERFVHGSMTSDATTAFTTTDQIARELKGDCRQHAMLAAAMCRAVGVPSRTAVGLLYVNDAERGPVMGFHMWTEVWVRGQWLGIDAVLGKGGLDAMHLKVTDASWHDVQSLKPLLPVSRVLGKMSIQIAEVNGEE